VIVPNNTHRFELPRFVIVLSSAARYAFERDLAGLCVCVLSVDRLQQMSKSGRLSLQIVAFITARCAITVW
jgi:hypothetical protein